MQLTVLGSYGPYPAPGGACSGYLLEHEGSKILLDCGNGVLSRLQKYIKPWEVEAILLSHLHADHISDLFILKYALDMARGKQIISDGVKLYLPKEPVEESQRIPYKEVYQMNYLKPEKDITIGPFQITFLPTVHPLDCLAMKIRCGDKTLVYSGDTEYFPQLEQFAAGCDLFLCEANFQDDDIEASRRNHLSARQAAEIAQKGEVKKLLLTHLPAEKDAEVSLKEAKSAFAQAELVQEEKTFTI